jgi:hypothetical protein
MGEIHAPRPPDCPRELDDLSRVSITPGSVYQPSGQAEGPVRHGIDDQRLHAGQFARRRWSLGISHDGAADGSMADDGNDIHSNPRFGQSFQVAR